MTADTSLDPPWQTRYMGSLGSMHDDSDFNKIGIRMKVVQRALCSGLFSGT